MLGGNPAAYGSNGNFGSTSRVERGCCGVITGSGRKSKGVGNGHEPLGFGEEKNGITEATFRPKIICFAIDKIAAMPGREGIPGRRVRLRAGVPNAATPRR